MKKLAIVLGLIVIVAQASWGQTFSVQGVLKDQYGKTLSDGYYYTVTFRLYDAQSGGDELWSETNGDVRTRNGVFVVELGEIHPFGSLSFAQTYWLGVTVEGSAEMTPRMKLVKVPYSFSVIGVDNTFPSAGKVGVGTTHPSTDLYVSGSGGTYVAVNASNGDAGYAFDADGSNEWVLRCTSADSSLRITEAGVGDALIVRPGENVGIGTDRPVSKLHVSGAGGTNVDFTANGRLRSDNDDGGLWVSSDRFVGGHDTSKVGFYTGEDWRLTVQPNGNVGIGTTHPSARLDVNGNIRLSSGGAVLFSDDTSLASVRLEEAASTVTHPGNILIHADSDADSTGEVQFFTNDTTRMVVANNGHIGIGAPSPGAPLEVAGDITFRGDLLQNGSPATSSLWSTSDSTVYYNEGHVGIGKTTPEYALDVNGHINATDLYKEGQQFFGTPWRTIGDDEIAYSRRVDIGNCAQSGPVAVREFVVGYGHIGRTDHVSRKWARIWSINGPRFIGKRDLYWDCLKVGYMYYTSKYSMSDRRVKQNIRPVSNGLDKVLSLSGVMYDINTETHPSFKNRELREDEKTTDRLGFVVQELKEIVPELVGYDEDTELYVIQNYEQLFPVISEAIKELNAENEDLERRIVGLESAVGKLRQMKMSEER